MFLTPMGWIYLDVQELYRCEITHVRAPNYIAQIYTRQYFSQVDSGKFLTKHVIPKIRLTKPSPSQALRTYNVRKKLRYRTIAYSNVT